MKALIWKELRENWIWALVAGGAFAVALWNGLTTSRYGQPDFYSLSQDGVTLCRKQFLIVTTFGAPAIGLLLGFLQILPELKRDRWAALLHRPVSRGTIFFGKAVAGVLLYVLATVPAFAFVTWQVATPGNFASPFVAGMIRPGLADIATGLLYYFAALVVSLQRGGWVGLRLIPLLAAVHVSYFVLNTPLFYVALEATLIMLLALLVAAWGLIRHQEVLKARPLAARVAYLAVIFYGVCGLGDLGRSLLKAVEPKAPYKAMRYELSRDGMPLLLTYVGNVVTSATDIKGQPLSGDKFKVDRVRNQTVYLSGVTDYIGDAHGWKQSERPDPYRDSRTYMWPNYPYSYPRMEQWFQLRNPRYYVCYLPVQKEVAGRLDDKGFQPAEGSIVPFSKEVKTDYVSEDIVSLQTPESVRFAFLARREIKPLDLPTPGPVYGIGRAYVSKGQSSIETTGVALPTELVLYDKDGGLKARLPYQHDVDRWGDISFTTNFALDRFHVRYDPSIWIDAKTRKTMPSYLDEMDAGGNVIHFYELAPLPSFPRPPTWSVLLERRLRCPAYFYGEMLYRKIGAQLGSTRLAKALNDQWTTGRKTTMEIITWSGSLSVILAVVTLIWARRSQFSWRSAISWSLFVLLLNFAGLITFWLAADWPRLVACASCRRRRPVHTTTCPSCAQGWPIPQATGIEIFDQPREYAK